MANAFPSPILTPAQPDVFFSFSNKDMAILAARDPKLAEVIARTGPIKRRIYPEPFTGLLRSILSQQISSKARDSIWQRLLDAFAPISAADFTKLTPEQLRTCGISRRKSQYMLGIASAFAKKELVSEKLAKMGDNELIAQLTGLPGIGKWTAEMLLIFTFRRKNILSYNDLGIQNGLRLLHGHKTISMNIYMDYCRKYSPLCTLASFYLWEIAGNKAI